MITFLQDTNILQLKYKPENVSNIWVFERLREDGEITLRKTFTFKPDDIQDGTAEEDDTSDINFILGNIDQSNKYYCISGEKLNIPFSVYFDKEIRINIKHFIAIRDISIFKKLSKLINTDLYISTSKDANLNYSVFLKLISSFPNTTELDKYAHMRIASILREELDCIDDKKEEYEKYLNSKKGRSNISSENLLKESELSKYLYLHSKLVTMLRDQNEYIEKTWQHEIISIIEVIFPKYLLVLEEVPIKDIYNKKSKRVDFLLVDSNGNLDIIEIKRPYSEPILTKSTYRHNYVPLRELSGSVMQIEKYIFLLNKWSKAGEDYLTSRYRDRIPPSITIKITNPTGIIIMGRDDSISQKQMADFEIIKRKYKNIVDIITYDDLLRRLKLLIDKFSL